MKRNIAALVAALLLLIALPVVAQETTGGIQGTVSDSSGGVLPGVTVTATNKKGQQFTVITDSNGDYRFPALPPGSYSVTATLAGMEDVTVPNFDVRLGTTPRVDVTMQLGAVAETLTVTAEAPLVDVTRSAITTSVTREQIETLPRGRDFTDVVEFTPGAKNDFLAGGIAIDGATGLENRYIIDGIDTTDPQIGDSSVPMRAEFMEEIQVKTAGYAAEYGGSTGGVINAITRSGSNEFSGGVLVDYEDNSLNEDRPELDYTPDGDGAQLYNYHFDDRKRWDPGVFLGGPILRDRLWFFGSYQPGLVDIDRTVDFRNGVTDTYHRETDIDYATGNITSILASKLSFKAGFSISPYETTGGLPARNGLTTTTAQSAYDTGVTGERETYSMNLDYIVSPALVISGRGGYYLTDAKDTGIPLFDIIHNYSTSSHDPATTFPNIPEFAKQPPGFFSDPFYGGVRAKDEYTRESGALDFSWYFTGAGEHALKAGFQREKIHNDVSDGYNADRILYYWDRTFTTTTGESIRGEYGYFRLLRIATFGEAETNNDAIFLQDAWTVLPNVTLNIGVRAENERIPNFGAVGPKTAIEFDYNDKIAPRLGFAWDLFNDAQWKVYGSYGVYYDVMKYELPRGSFGGDKWVDFFFTFDNPDYTLNDAATCRTGKNTLNDNPVCPAGSLIEKIDRRHNSADPEDSTIDPALKPMELWEAQLGADHELAANMKVGARYVHKELVRAIEDVGVLVPGVGEVYYIANPGYGLTTSIAARPFPKAQREYDAIELTFERRMTNNWALNASYTYSRLWGNYTGLASADEQNSLGGGARLSPNVSRSFDVIHQSYDKNLKFHEGRLPTDRPHQFKAQLTYQFPWQLTAGVYQYIGSGTPVTEFALVPIHNFFMPNGRGNLGRTPTLTQTDLALTKNFFFGNNSLQLSVNVLNLWDEDAAIKYWTIRNREDLPLSEDEFFAGGWDYEEEVSKVEGDPAYLQPDAFQSGREVRLGLKYTF